MRKRKRKEQIDWISFLSGAPKKQVAKEIEKDLSIAYNRMEQMTELSQDENIDFDIEIIECEFKDSCQKYSEFCFNEYVDVCSTRSVLLLNKLLKDRGSEVMRKL